MPRSLAELGEADEAFTRAATHTRRSTRGGRQEGTITKLSDVLVPEVLDFVTRIATMPGRVMQEPAGTEEMIPFGNAVGGLVVGSPMTPRGTLGTSMGEIGGRAAPKGAKPLKDLGKPEDVGLGLHETTKPETIKAMTEENTGYSVHLPSGETPKSGLMMGIYANNDPRTRVVEGELSVGDIFAHAKTNKTQLAQDDKYFGTWANEGKTYLDVAKRFEPDKIRTATKFGERTGQKEGYDAGAGKTFPVGNWDEFVQSPEFVGRLDAMAKQGRTYLEAHPAPEWWSTPAFERVYGKERMPQVAGFTGTTAPNAAPRENLQTMSEYMRRFIKGEKVVQPNWRVGPNEMTRKEGTEIGMEKTRTANLERASRGEAISGDKVSREQRALMGDPRAVVIDRHHVRASEAPERGIFASTEEGTIGSKAAGTRNYNLLESVITKRADELGRDPRDFSADVWTGIRETIKNTNQLYGTKFKGGSVTGESKSYNDIFEDLLRDKAAHMKIPQAEFEARLGRGDATLLTALLSTPAIAALLSQVMGGRGDGRADDRI
jgi:hypothetical protein